MVKRAAVLLLILTASDMIFLKSVRWPVFAGLLTGFLISIGKLAGNEWIFEKIFRTDGEKAALGSIALFSASQLALIPVIVLAYFFSAWTLYGLTAGILTVPIITMINSVTEALGITKNNFE